jgi:drug/metabolite transporter (DMT)-like permease
MAFCYGVGGLLAGRNLSHVPPVVVALGSTAVSAVAAAPAGIVQQVGNPIGWKAVGSVVVLGILGTAVAYLLFFALVRGAGAAYASLVTYLCPPVALVYGAVFLDERFGTAAFGGLALILAGVALGTGALRFATLRRRSLASEA